ncbi:MAG: hypothetical protein ACLFUF_01265 [Opitutales bacterium]
MNIYAHRQRVVRVDILSTRGWLSANVHVGEVNLFLDTINASHSLLRLSEVTFEDGNQLAFLGLQRDGIQIIIPFESNEMIARETPPNWVVHRVACLLSTGDIEGDLPLPPEIRVSDHMAKCSSYFAVYRTSCDIWNEQSDADKRHFAEAPTALINANAIIGITER